jgi:long-chain acyl-CoA synthetase
MPAGVSVVVTDIKRAFQSLKVAQPTFIIAPPVFYNTLLQLASASPATASSLGTALGAHIRFLITGMAPISRRTLDRFWDSDIPLLEAYGMTECGMIAWNTPTRYRVGTVGQPLDRHHIRFSDAGEVLLKRDTPLSLGYFRADEADVTGTFRPDGIIGTGDLARFDSDGFLTFDGRLKDLIALSSGLKVNPSEIENRVRQIPGVDDVVAVGRPHGNGIAGVIIVSDDYPSSAAFKN